MEKKNDLANNDDYKCRRFQACVIVYIFNANKPYGNDADLH